MWLVEFYETANGRTPIIDFIESLPVKSQAKCLKYIELLTERGLSLPANYVKHIEDALWELRPEYGGVEYRFLFWARSNPDRFTIVHALVKKSQKLKGTDIERALARIEELRGRSS